MKVHLIKQQTILDFITNHASGRKSFGNWLMALKYADWTTPEDIAQTFKTADLLGKSCDRVVFNIGGNHYRMICKYHFGLQKVHLFICWIGKHEEYDEICRKGEQYIINNY